MAIELRYRIVDVFTDRPLAGNALCVVLDPCPEPVMPAIAREVNLSETTFPTVVGPSEYEMRIFTPGDELPFAGHPSLGTAWVLGPARWTQHTAGATVTVDADAAGATMQVSDPVLTELDPAPPAAALGLAREAVESAFLAVSGGTAHVLVLTTAGLEGLRPEMVAVAAAARVAGGIGLCPVRRIDDRTLHVRAFFPAAGIAEDPGTGSAAGPIALVARRHLGTGADVTILQGAEVGRPCRIEVHAEEGELRVRGAVAGCAEGRFTL